MQFLLVSLYKGDIPTRNRGSLVHLRQRKQHLRSIQRSERGTLFIGPQVKVYEGMIVGENSRPGDLDINVCKSILPICAHQLQKKL